MKLLQFVLKPAIQKDFSSSLKVSKVGK